MLTKNSTITMQGSKIIFETLKILGVDTVFGYPGGIVLDLYNELYGQNEITHVLTRHEQSAVHAAEGYARETGKCGVVLVTSGPGATNTLTGIVNAYLDGYPLIVITGQVFQSLLGKNAFQEADICDIVRSCTKKVYQIKSAEQIQDTFNEAFATALSGKKGPVVIDIVKDVFQQKAQFQYLPKQSFDKYPKINDLDIVEIIHSLRASKKPVIIAGGGVKHSNAEEYLLQFAKRHSIPVVSTMMGLGTFPQYDAQYLGMIGIFGDNSANKIVRNSDLILSLGARFNDRITCVFKNTNLGEKFIQVDLNKKELGNFIPAKIQINADIKELLESLLKKDSDCLFSFENWSKEVNSYKKENIQRKSKTNRLHSFEVIRKIEEFTKGQNITFTSEVGQHQLWAVQNLELYKDRKIFVSGGSGTMGFGLPAAIGAAVGNPKNTIVCIAGDGSFQMSLHELATCVDYNLNIKIIILNNGYLGMVRQLQEKFCNERYSETKISNPNFVQLAQSYKISAEQVSNLQDAEKALKRAFDKQGTYILEFMIEPMEVL